MKREAAPGGKWTQTRILIALAVVTAAIGLAALKIDGVFIVAGLVAAAIGSVLISYPFATVPIYFALIYLRPGDMYPQLEKLRLVLLVVALMAGAFVLRTLVYRTWKLQKNVQLIFIAGLLAAIGLSIIDAFYRTAALEKFSDVSRYLVMVFLVVHIVDSLKKYKVMMWSILISLTILALWNFVLWASGQKVIDNGGSGGMAGGFLGDGNDFALALNVMLPIPVFQFMATRHRWTRVACAVVIVSFVLSIIATYSRGGLLGMIAVFAFAFWFYLLRSRNWALGIAMIVVLATVGTGSIILFAPDNFKERMAGMHDYEKDESALGRLDAWGAGMRMFADRPVLGVGAGCFPDAYGRKYKPMDAVAANWREAHSLYVQTFAELGSLGAFFLFGLCAVVSVHLRRIHQYGLPDAQTQKEVHYYADAVTTGLIGFLVSGAFLSVAYYPHLYIMSAETMILMRIAEEESRKSPDLVPDAR
ncbi:MAG: O-antigen ligase family protein [Deltaproteobacteria bacterium]|nr:O-antigen ligase family protein [Deltaproteobacteria bacterium]